MLNFIILTFLFAPPILATLTQGEMASALIAADNTGTLEETFKKYEEEQDTFELAGALGAVTKVQVYMPKVIACIRVAHDSSPNDNMCVNRLVHGTFFHISFIADTESFTNVITSLKPSDGKLLASIRYWTLGRNDAVNVLKRIMDKSPELIAGDLPSWIAFHTLDRYSRFYKPAREESSKYLTSLATQSVLEEALSIVKRNEHYKAGSEVMCCDSQDYIPKDLANRIEALLELVKARKTLVNELEILPTVLVDMVLDYIRGSTD